MFIVYSLFRIEHDKCCNENVNHRHTENGKQDTAFSLEHIGKNNQRHKHLGGANNTQDLKQTQGPGYLERVANDSECRQDRQQVYNCHWCKWINDVRIETRYIFTAFLSSDIICIPPEDIVHNEACTRNIVHPQQELCSVPEHQGYQTQNNGRIHYPVIYP